MDGKIKTAYPIDYDDYLEHHGIRGQKWGIRRYQNKDGTLTEAGKEQRQLYRSKIATADDHYKRAIKNYEQSLNPSNSRKERKRYEAQSVYQYGKAQEYNEVANKINKKLYRNGVIVQPSENQLSRQQQASELFVKKCFARRLSEYTVNQISIGAQMVAQIILTGKPGITIATDYSDYKIKKH